MNASSTAPPRPSIDLNYRRDTFGCTVTWRNPDGTERTRSEPGHVYEALAHICKRIPAGATIRAISTPRTILRDLQNNPRTYGGHLKGKKGRVDQYSVERMLLSKIGRMDLLPEEAKA